MIQINDYSICFYLTKIFSCIEVEILNIIEKLDIDKKLLSKLENKKNHETIVKIDITDKIEKEEIIKKLNIIYDKIFLNKKILMCKSVVLEINTNKNEEYINFFLKNYLLTNIIFTKKYDKINLGIDFDIKNHKIEKIVYKNRFLCSINKLPEHINKLEVRFKPIKNFKLDLPKNLKILALNEIIIDLSKYDIEDIGIINKKFKNNKNYYNIVNSNFLIIYKYEKNMINIDNLSNKIKILYLLDNFNESIDFLPCSVEKLVLGSKFNKSLNDLPTSIKSLELKHKIDNLNFLNQLPNYIEYLTFNIENIYQKKNLPLFAGIKCLKSIKNIKIISQRSFTSLKYIFIESIIRYRQSNNLNFQISCLRVTI